MTTETCRILLVDDDLAILRDYSAALRRLGEVTAASDGVEALTAIAASTFDVIVSDIAMPRLNGIELLSMVRQHDLEVPIILITGQPELDTAVKAVEYGAFRYLTKPVDLDALWEAVRRATRIRKLTTLRREASSIEGLRDKPLGDRASLDARFQQALDKFWIAYQPVLAWQDGRIVGYEALARSEDPTLQTAPDLLDAAERLNRLHDLGRTVRALVDQAAHQKPDTLFFVNVHPVELNDFALFSPTTPLSTVASRVVLELSERLPLDVIQDAAARIAKLRETGFRIALDDFGAGYSGLSSFALLEPDYVKIDRCLVRGIESSARKQSVIRAMIRLCQGELGMQVICEGVETGVERDALVELGADLFQGYLFGLPGAILGA